MAQPSGARPAAILLLLLVLLSLGAGCAQWPRYAEPDEGESHATILFDRADGQVSRAFGGLKVIPQEINGLSPGPWSRWDFHRFRVVPGDIVLLVSVPMDSGLVGSCFLEFDTSAGEIVTVTTDGAGQVVAHDSSGNEVARAKTRLEVVPNDIQFQVVRPQ